MSDTEQRESNWDTAQIEDAALTGSGSKARKARLERVLALLGSSHSN